MSSIYLQLHLGIGDAIICQGMIRAMAKRYETVVVPCKRRNAISVQEMLQDLDNVLVWPMPDKNADAWAGWAHGSVPVRYLPLGIHSKQPLRKDWDRMMYEQAQVEFVERWRGFKEPKNIGMPAQKLIAFVHDDPSRGFTIDIHKLPGSWSYVTKSDSIWDHLYWLKTAPEIHVIDSCFLCLADSIPTAATRLVLHAYATAKAKPAGPPTLRKNWEVIS